jgi:hypothetical protein
MTKTSLGRKVKRGRVRLIWNNAMNRMDIYLKTTRGTFLLADKSAERFIQKGPGITEFQVDALIEK